MPWISLFHFPCYAVRVDRSSTRAASSPLPTRALSAPSTTRRYFPPGRRISSCRPRRADLGTKFAARTISPQTSFPRASSAREFSSNKSSISSSRKKKAVFHYSRYYFWTTRVRGEREREREGERANSRQSTCCVTFPQPRFESTKSMCTKA